MLMVVMMTMKKNRRRNKKNKKFIFQLCSNLQEAILLAPTSSGELGVFVSSESAIFIEWLIHMLDIQ